MTPRVLVGGVPDAPISSSDRGFRYGDGLFETVLLSAGRAPLWPRHMARLAEGCTRLGLPPPDPGLLWREVEIVARGLDRAAARIAISRGDGVRGYAAAAGAVPTRVVEAAPAPAYPASDYRRGVCLHPCETRLAAQPRLAGIKHANRLEQVLARAEWDDPAIGEGLMCDPDGHAISATAANLFAVVDGILVTPALDRAGVAGVARAEVLARRPDAVVRPLPREELMRAEEVFLTSSLRGIVPVRALGAHAFDIGPQTCALLIEWQQAGLMEELAP